jgi:hypothetical protein
MSEISRNFNIDMSNGAIYQAATDQITASVSILREHEYPDELRLNCEKGGFQGSRFGIQVPDGYTPLFIAQNTGPQLYSVRAELPFPSNITSKGINSSRFTIQVPPAESGGGIITMNTKANRRGPSQTRTTITAAAVINGLTSTLKELRRGVPILGYTYSFLAYNEQQGPSSIPRQSGL